MSIYWWQEEMRARGTNSLPVQLHQSVYEFWPLETTGDAQISESKCEKWQCKTCELECSAQPEMSFIISIHISRTGIWNKTYRLYTLSRGWPANRPRPFCNQFSANPYSSLSNVNLHISSIGTELSLLKPDLRRARGRACSLRVFLSFMSVVMF
jgi:hypothetical protein